MRLSVDRSMIVDIGCIVQAIFLVVVPIRWTTEADIVHACLSAVSWCPRASSYSGGSDLPLTVEAAIVVIKVLRSRFTRGLNRWALHIFILAWEKGARGAG